MLGYLGLSGREAGWGGRWKRCEHEGSDHSASALPSHRASHGARLRWPRITCLRSSTSYYFPLFADE
eukprot:11680300-Karenia_brevis.AAC.1